MNKAYPGEWRITIERLLTDGDEVFTWNRLNWNGETVWAISSYLLRDGMIVREIDWWPVPYTAPAGRDVWVERLPDDVLPVTS